MQVNLVPTEDDDPKFVELVHRIVQRALQCYKPLQLYIIQIDTWFDHKWEAYAGRIGYCMNVWLDPLRVPPFSPNRVLNQFTFERSGAEPFVFDPIKAPALHFFDREATHQSAHRRLKDITPSGLYVWYSSNTRKDDRACLMLYCIHGEQNIGWYVSFLNRNGWKIGLTEGISKAEVKYFLRAVPESAEELKRRRS